MALSNITVKGVTPDLSILGNYQRFSYEDNVASFQLDNIFVSTTLIPSRINFEFRNNQLSGFRWYHTTTSTDSFGSLALQSFVNASPDGTDIIIFDQDGSINFVAPITVGSLSIGNNLNMNDFKIINLGTPTLTNDTTTKEYVDGVVDTFYLSAMASVDLYGLSAVCYSINNATKNTLTANVPQKIAGITSYYLTGFSFSGFNNRVMYTEVDDLVFHAFGSVQISSTVAGTTNINVELVKNGAPGLLLPVFSERIYLANAPQISFLTKKEGLEEGKTKVSRL
jgi:hypothetical protein